MKILLLLLLYPGKYSMYMRSLPSFRASIFLERTYINRTGHQPRGCVNFRCSLCTDHKCCGNKNSKPPFSTNLKPTFIQQNFRCLREQCRHVKCRYSKNEHILIKLVIRMVYKISVLAVNWLIIRAVIANIPNHRSPPISDQFISSKVFDVHENSAVISNIDILKTNIY